MPLPSVRSQTHWQALRLYISSTPFFDWCLRKGDTLSLHEASRRRREMCLWRHMRSPVSSAWPTAFESKQFLEDPHARTSPSVAHSVFFHLQTKHSIVSCPVPTLRQDARSVGTLEHGFGKYAHCHAGVKLQDLLFGRPAEVLSRDMDAQTYVQMACNSSQGDFARHVRRKLVTSSSQTVAHQLVVLSFVMVFLHGGELNCFPSLSWFV